MGMRGRWTARVGMWTVGRGDRVVDARRQDRCDERAHSPLSNRENASLNSAGPGS